MQSMEEPKARKIKKWDEVHGEYEVEVSEGGGCDPEEAAGAGPSISKNPMRSIEDMVEQNDNNFDGEYDNLAPTKKEKSLHWLIRTLLYSVLIAYAGLSFFVVQQMQVFYKALPI